MTKKKIVHIPETDRIPFPGQPLRKALCSPNKESKLWEMREEDEAKSYNERWCKHCIKLIIDLDN